MRVGLESSVKVRGNVGIITVLMMCNGLWYFSCEYRFLLFYDSIMLS